MTTNILPRDEFTLDLLATVLARMFEHDRQQQKTATPGIGDQPRPDAASTGDSQESASDRSVSR